MVPADIHDFFVAAGGAAGALVGLLFVAISVSAERLSRPGADSQLHRIRAVAALTSFTNALAVSMFALVPGDKIGWTATVLGATGVSFVMASLLLLARMRPVRWPVVRDAAFLASLTITFAAQLWNGVEIILKPDNPGDVNTIAILVIICFLVGVARAWELIGGPSIGISQQVGLFIRGHGQQEAAPGGEEPPAGR